MDVKKLILNKLHLLIEARVVAQLSNHKVLLITSIHHGIIMCKTYTAEHRKPRASHRLVMVFLSLSRDYSHDFAKQRSTPLLRNYFILHHMPRYAQRLKRERERERGGKSSFVL